MHQLGYFCKYFHYFPPPPAAANPLDQLLQQIITANAAVMFSQSTCCMCHAIKRLFRGMGANLTVYELDEYSPRSRKELETALLRLRGGGATAVPVVFVGGKLVGGMDSVLVSHINGSLVPLLKEAGALWL